MRRFFSVRCYHCAPHVVRTYPSPEERRVWPDMHTNTFPEHDLIIFEEQL